MPRKRQPTAVLRANGSRHYTKAHLAEREAMELKAPKTDALMPPAYLSEQLSMEFAKLAPILIQMGVLSSVDGDGLAMYLIAKQSYLRATKKFTDALNRGDTDGASKWSAIQDRCFRQCRAAGMDLGLTVSSRCNLVIPNGATAVDLSGEEADLFGEG